MINTDDDIIAAYHSHGSKKVYDAAYAFMTGNLNALPVVGLRNPNSVAGKSQFENDIKKLIMQIS
jgi:hypothetical protein